MTKAELVNQIAAQTGYDKTTVLNVVEGMMEAVKTSIAANENVYLRGFGTFQTSERKARTGRNPQTGDTVKIAAATLPAFKAGKALKEKVNTKPKKAAAKKKK